MMWLPGQRTEDWLASVDALIDLQPDHASLYLLEIYPNAPLRDEMARAGWSVAPDDDAAEMYLEGLARLDRAGFEQYEISNVARPSVAPLTSQLEILAGRRVAWLRLWRARHVPRRAMAQRQRHGGLHRSGAAGQDVRLDRRALGDAERLEEALFMGLRVTDGLDLESMPRHHGIDIWERYGQDLRGLM